MESTNAERGQQASLGGERVPDIDAIFAEWDRPDSPGCAFGVYGDEGLRFAHGYGRSNLEHHIPITAGSIFHVASISKQFTGVCIALLAQDGRLSPDDDVRGYLPEVPDLGDTITIRHLIHHTSGLRDQWSLLELAGWREHDLITDDDVLDVVRRQTALNFAPGERFLYSNTGYTLLSLIVRRVAGVSLRAFAQNRLFEPLGMTHTHFHDNHRETVPGRTQAYELADSGAWEISVPVFDVAGTTSLQTTVEDFCRWHQHVATRQIGDGIYNQIHARGVLNNGTELDYAWGLAHRAYRGARVVEHSGADSGYRAHYLRLPEHRCGVAVLANADRVPVVRLAEQVVDAVIGHQLPTVGPARRQPLARRGQVSSEASDSSRLSGVYRSEDGSEYLRVQIDGTRPTLGFTKPWELARIDTDTFNVVAYPSLQLAFEPVATPGEMMMVRSFGPTGEGVRFRRFDPPSVDPDALGQFAGTYDGADIGTSYDIVSADDTLVLRRRKFREAPLIAVSKDTFVCDGFSETAVLTFDRVLDRTVSGFTLNMGRLRHLAFVKR